MKTGGKNKRVAFIILVSVVYSIRIRSFFSLRHFLLYLNLFQDTMCLVNHCLIQRQNRNVMSCFSTTVYILL